MEYQDPQSVSGDQRRKSRGYPFLWLHRCQQGQHGLPGKELWQIQEGEPWYGYKYAAGIHTSFIYVDNSLQRGELPRFLLDDVHNHQ